MLYGTASPRTKLIVVACAALLFGIFILLTCLYPSRQGQDDRDHFNSTAIRGKFVTSIAMHHTMAFQVDNRPDDWLVCWPKIGEGSTSADFEYFVKPSDSIIKPVNADTLYLIRNGQTYRYTFR